ncbi:MAG: hypothetical protein JWP47_2990 [Polaromonas sp.]|jgi:CheY-like chemotaxis protein|nr:hypothetical protein [Polaromonas sp.]
MSFALYRRPGAVIFLDDDPEYLEMLAMVMPPEWYARLFLRPVACIETLLMERDAWESDIWRHQEMVNRWREGVALIPQILQYWREDATTRFALTQVCVVDYSMPAMSGLRVLSELTQWEGSRILLTGRADEQLAVSAFNRGLIDQFIAKQLPDIRLRLTEAIRARLSQPNPRHEQTWRATLSREQHALLGDAGIERALDQLAMTHGWVEHIVLGAPFGVLALDRTGQVSWLQLEPQHRLAELAEMAESQGCERAIVNNVASGELLIDLELRLALGGSAKPQTRPATAVASQDALVYTALFPVDPSLAPGPASSHGSFVAAHSHRSL